MREELSVEGGVTQIECLEVGKGGLAPPTRNRFNSELSTKGLTLQSQSEVNKG